MVAAGKAGVEAWPGFVWDDLEDVVRSQEQKSGWWVGDGSYYSVFSIGPGVASCRYEIAR